MDIQEIFSTQLKSLPFETKFRMRSNAGAVLYVAASVTSRDRAGFVGVNVLLDGKQVASPTIYTNEPGVARPLVQELAVMPTDFDEHTLTLEPLTPWSIAGQFDFACASVFYLGVSVDPVMWRFRGALPQSKTFRSPMVGTALLYLAGSGWMKQARTSALEVSLNGQVVARTYMTPGIAGSHFAYPPVFVPVKLTAKQHELKVSVTDGVTTDENDLFQVGIIY
jgi:hypothetical protein